MAYKGYRASAITPLKFSTFNFQLSTEDQKPAALQP